MLLVFQHRKTAVSFRDHHLLEVLQVGLNMLRQIAQRALAGASAEQVQRPNFVQSSLSPPPPCLFSLPLFPHRSALGVEVFLPDLHQT